jgi:GxxExxY protein
MNEIEIHNKLSEQIIGSAIEVHKILGPGLLESAYELCLARELALRNIEFEIQKPMPIVYKGSFLDCGYRLDIVVGGLIIVELKSVDVILAIHKAQIVSNLKLSGLKLGLLLNFNVEKMKNGIYRFVNHLEEPIRSLGPQRPLV